MNTLIAVPLAVVGLYAVGAEVLVRTKKIPAVKDYVAVQCSAYSATVADCGKNGTVRINTHAMKQPMRFGESIGCIFVHEYSPIFRSYLGLNLSSVPCSRW